MIWEGAAPLLQRALERSDDGHSLEFVRAQIERGDARLWVGPGSAAVTEEVRDCHIWLAGGDLDELRAMERQASAWAKEQGFDRMSILGRKGWARALPDYRTIPLLVKAL